MHHFHRVSGSNSDFPENLLSAMMHCCYRDGHDSERVLSFARLQYEADTVRDNEDSESGELEKYSRE